MDINSRLKVHIVTIVIFIQENSYWTTQNPDNVDTMMKMLEVHLKAEVAKTDAFKPLSGESDAHLLWRGPLTKIKTPVPTIRVLCNKRNTANPNDDKDFLAMNDPNQTRAQRRRANRRRANQRRYDRLQCDITFSSGLGVENTLLIHQMFSLQPEAFKLYHFVRIWIHIDEFCFKRYMVALLVLFYMQNHGLMPSLVDMQKDVAEKFIDGDCYKLKIIMFTRIIPINFTRLERVKQQEERNRRLWKEGNDQLRGSSRWFLRILRNF